MVTIAMKTSDGLPRPFVEEYKLPEPLVVDNLEVNEIADINELNVNVKAQIKELNIEDQLVIDELRVDVKAVIEDLETDTLKSKTIQLTDPTNQIIFESDQVSLKSNNLNPTFNFTDSGDINNVTVNGGIFKGKVFESTSSIDGDSLTKQTNTSTGTSNVSGFSAANSTDKIDMVMIKSSQRGTIRTSSTAFGIDVNATGSNKSLRLMTNSTPRITIDDTATSLSSDTVLTSSTASTSKTSGALVVSGGIGVSKDVTCTALKADSSNIATGDFSLVRLGSTNVTPTSLSVNGTIISVGNINTPEVILGTAVNSSSSANTATTKQYVDDKITASIEGIPEAPVVTYTDPIQKVSDEVSLKIRPNVDVPVLGTLSGLFINDDGELEINIGDIVRGGRGVKTLTLSEYLLLVFPEIPSLPLDLPKAVFITLDLDPSLAFTDNQRVGVKFQGTHRVPFFNFSDFVSDADFTYNDSSKRLTVKGILIDDITSSSTDLMVVNKKYVDELIRVGSNQPFALTVGGTFGLNKDLSFKYNNNHFIINGSDELESKVGAVSGSCITVENSLIDLDYNTDMFSVFDGQLGSRLSVISNEPIILNTNHALGLTINSTNLSKSAGVLDLSATVKSDLTTLKTDVTTIKGDIVTIKSDIVALQTGLGEANTSASAAATSASAAATSAASATAAATASASSATAASGSAASAALSATAATTASVSASASASTAVSTANAASALANTVSGRVDNLDDRIANTLDLNILTVKRLTVGDTLLPNRLIVNDTTATFTIPVIGTAITASGIVTAASVSTSAINSSTIGATTPGSGVFTSLSAGGINTTPIGATTPSTGAFTTLTATSFSTSALNSTPVGSTTPSTGAFTTLTANSLNSTPIGTTTPSTGAFTTLTATSINSTPVGSTTPSTGAFTTLSATNFSTSALNNTPIGSTTPSTGAFTTLTSGAATHTANLPLTLTSTSSSSSVIENKFSAALPTSGNVQSIMGVSGSTNNAFVQSFNYVGAGSTNNFWGLGLWGQANRFTVSNSAAAFTVPLTVTDITCTGTFTNSGSAGFTSLNNTPIGNLTPSTGAFTTLNASATIPLTLNSTASSSGSISNAFMPALPNGGNIQNIFGVGAATNNAVVQAFNYTSSGSSSNSYSVGMWGLPQRLTVSNSAVTLGAATTVTDTTASSSTTTGALIVNGGVGVAGAINCASLATGSLSIASLNSTPIGNVTPSTGAFTTLTANATLPLSLTSTSSTSNVMESVLMPSLGTGGNAQKQFGVAASNYNAFIQAFNYVGPGSASNSFGLGMWGFAQRFTLSNTAATLTVPTSITSTGISTSTTTGALTISGGLGVAAAIYCSSLNTTTLTTSTITTTGAASFASLEDKGFDFILGTGDQSSRGNTGLSRALVKETGSVLTLNFSNDFTGGVNVGSKLTVTGDFILPATSSVSHGTTQTYAMQNIALLSTKNTMMSFRDSSDNEIGTIFQNGFGGTTYGTTSDYRLKSDVNKLEGCLDKVLSVDPVSYFFRKSTRKSIGFLAHEIQQVCPEAVSNYKDATNEKGEPIYQNVDYGKLTTLLWGCIHELTKNVNDLSDRVSELTNELKKSKTK